MGVLALTGGEIGELHLVAIDYGPGRDEAADDFILYINEEIYCGVWEEGGYAVRPRVPSPEGLRSAPSPSLTVRASPWRRRWRRAAELWRRNSAWWRTSRLWRAGRS